MGRNCPYLPSQGVDPRIDGSDPYGMANTRLRFTLAIAGSLALSCATPAGSGSLKYSVGTALALSAAGGGVAAAVEANAGAETSILAITIVAAVASGAGAAALFASGASDFAEAAGGLTAAEQSGMRDRAASDREWSEQLRIWEKAKRERARTSTSS